MCMLVYRVCHEVEASLQVIGKPWQKPKTQAAIGNDPKWVQGLYLSLFPEMWRRNLNFQAAELGEKDFFYTHTLQLEVPDDKLEVPYFHVLLGMEYRLRSPDMHLA